MRVPLLFGLLFIFQFIFLGYSFAANGISSVNSFVEEKHSATDFRSRKQNSNGQRSDSGFDFIVSLERENISNAGTLTMDFDDDGNTNVSINTSSTPINSYLIFLNDNHSKSDRSDKVGEIVFENEIYGFSDDPSKTIFLSNVSKSGATYPVSSNDGFNARELENLNLYTDTTSFSTISHDWVSISSDSKTLRIGVKNGTYGDYIRVFTAVEQEPTVDFNLTSSNGLESTSSANLTVDLSDSYSENVTVNYTVTGTATGSGTDYTLANGTLTITSGNTSANITIAGIVNDALDENNETVIVTLSNPTNATLGSDTVHTYTILDNDNLPVVDFNTTTSSGAESVSSKALTVDLTPVSGRDVTVDYAITGTATGSGTDFTLTNGTLTISAGNTASTITIASIVNDALDEVDETVVVTLSNPTNATLGSDDTHTYTITDDDDPPVVDFNTTSSSGLESVSSKDLTVDLSATSSKDVTVNFTVTGTASGSGTDYTLDNGNITIAAGTTSGTITISNILDDVLDEANETVIVTLSNPSNATLGSDDAHTYTITDNDNAPVVDFNTTTSNGSESTSSKAITVDLSAASGQNVTVDYTVTGTATGSGTDYTLANGTLTISAGNTSGTITIASIVNDTLDEADETVILTLSNPSNATLGSDDVHTYTITDNDNPPVVDFNTTSSNGAESVSSKALTVDLSVASGQDVTVDYTVTGTATGSGTDFTLANGTLTIPAGNTSGTITIAGIIDDALDEVDETVIVTLSNPNNATLGSDDAHTYTITDNDNAPVVDFNTTSSNGAESVSSKDLTVDISATSGKDITVDYTVTGTATGSGTDYTLANGTLTIPAGNTTGTITIAGIVDDALDEANETVIVTLSNPSNASLGSDDAHTYTITDDDDAPIVDFNTTTSNGAESTSSKAITVDLSAASGQDVTVDFALTGTATGGGTDYTLANGTLTISAGNASGTITIAGIVNDTLDEANETVIVTLSNPTNATLGSDDVHTYTITDNDNPPVVDFNTTTSNGAESVSSKALTVDLSAASGQDVTVDYAVTGTATGGGIDYTLANGTLTITAGNTSGTITISSIVDDSLDEVDETVIVTLSNPSNATLGSDDAHTYTITDNDNAPTVDFNSTSSSGAESVSSKNLTVDVSAASARDITVDYTVTGTATGSGTDYTLANGTLTIPAGSTSGTITIASIVDDALDEANETVIVTLSNPSNASLGSDDAHTYTITDNDDAPVVDFNAVTSNGAESVSSKALTVDLSAASGQDVTVDFAVSGTATGSGTDYTLANGTLTISAGNTTGTITIASIVDDGTAESNETVIVTLSNPSNATLGSDDVHTYTIVDNDTAADNSIPTVDFNSASSSGSESASSAAITVDLSSSHSADVTVNFSVTGTATGSGTDYTLANGTLTIPAGNTSGNITIASIVDDALDEDNETVILSLSSPSNANLGSDDTHTYTITDNDDAPTVEFYTTSSTDPESVSSKTVTIKLSALSGKVVTVDYAVTGTATGGGTDYTLPNGTLTINPGNISGTTNIAGIIDDALDEANETVILTLSNPSNATLDSDVIYTHTITDNDSPPEIDFNTTSSSGAESTSSAALTVDLSSASGQDVTVDYAVTGTATGGGTDYTLANGTLTISAGNTSGTITIAGIVNDALDEANETVIVTLSNPSNATIGTDEVHTYTITDNDDAPTVDFNSTSSSGSESVSSKGLTVDLSAASGQDVTVDYAVTGTATGGGTDYTLANGTLTITAGNTSGTITIAGIVDDALDETNETVIVTLSNPSNASLGSDDTHTYTITDNDDAPTIDFNVTSSSGAESVDSKALTVDLSAASGQDITVEYTVTGTATGSGTDYTLANGTLTIPAGSTSGTITIASIVDDTLDEVDETVIITLSNPSNATLGSDDAHTYTITDNDAAPTVDFNVTASSGAESVNSKAVTVDLSAASAKDVTVDFAVTGTATGGGTDYTLANGTLTISAGNTSGTITIASIDDDSLDEANETVILTLSNPSNATLGSDDTHTYTITDNDGLPTIDFNATSSNGAESISSKALTVDLSAASGQDVTVNYTVTGTATGGGTDYTLANGTLTISAGDTSGTITIAGIVDDTLDEVDETVIVTLSSPTNATLGSDDAHTYTITDNDSVPVVDFNLTASSGAESVTSATIDLDLSAVSSKTVTVDYDVSGTASDSGVDYNFILSSGTLTISPGSTTGALTIGSISDDNLDEVNETVIVTLSNPSNATLGSDDVHTYTIIDNDDPPAIDFNTTSSTGAESVTSKAITVDLSEVSSKDITVDYTVTGTATGGGTDYTLANGTLTISAGDTTGTITIAGIVNDTLDEADETVIITLSNPSNATVGSDSVHTYTITDNDSAPTVDFNATSSNGAESESSKALTVDLSAASAQDVTVDYSVNGTATGGGTDYTLANGTLTISAGSTSGTITIASIVDDALDESDETVIVTLSNPTNATLGSDDTHTYTITDNELPIINFNATSSSGLESTSSAAITVGLTSAHNSNITVDYTVTGTATGGGTDYTLANGTLTITAGNTTGTITIAGIVDDNLDEGDETVIITLSNPTETTLGSDTVHTYYINDNDDTTDPTITATIPTDNATNVDIDENIEITFSEDVDVESGNIIIYKSDDNSIVETIDVTSAQVTGTGTSTIIIDLTDNLDYETEYYILIQATAFDDESGNSFAGVTSNTVLNFETRTRLTDPTNKPDVVEILDAMSTISSNWAFKNMDAVEHRLSWLNRMSHFDKNQYELKINFNNKFLDELVNNDMKIETSREATEWLSGLSEKAIDELISVSGKDDCNESLTKFMREECLEKFDTFINKEIAIIPNELTHEYKNEIIDIKKKYTDMLKSKLNIDNDWAAWVTGEITLANVDGLSSNDLQSEAMYIGIDRHNTNYDSIFGISLSYGTDDIKIGSDESKVQSENYALSLYGSKKYGYQDIPFINEASIDYSLGIGNLNFDTTRTDIGEVLSGERAANQVFGSLTVRGNSTESDQKIISPYAKGEFSITEFDSYTETGGDTSLNISEQTSQRANISVGTDISLVYNLKDSNYLPWVKFEYGLAFASESQIELEYPSETNPITYIISGETEIEDFWKVGVGIDLFRESSESLDEYSFGLGYEFESGGVDLDYSNKFYLDFEWDF